MDFVLVYYRIHGHYVDIYTPHSARTQYKSHHRELGDTYLAYTRSPTHTGLRTLTDDQAGSSKTI